jgi:phosphoglycerol transferase MdoB-like AlkP superfamily enzyme
MNATEYTTAPAIIERDAHTGASRRRYPKGEAPNTPAPKAKKARAARPARPAQDMSVMAQISAAARRPAALIVGIILGAFVPVAAYIIAHHETQARPMLWLLVAAALVFSALSVFDWTRRAFGSAAKAAAFCILTEGTMLATWNNYLSYAALALLIAINATATGAQLATERPARRPV